MDYWSTIKSLLLFFGPMLAPKIIAYYRSVGTRPSFSPPIRPPPPAAQRSLTLLALTSIIALISSIPYFAPPEIFHLTQSRLQIPVDVLFTRLATISNGTLNPSQTALREHLTSLESRLLYFAYGPSVISNCKFCSPESPSSYFNYAIPSILAPHLLTSAILALSTSGLFGGTEARKWRVPSQLLAMGLAFLELWLTYSYNYQSNAAATRLGDVYPFFWRMRTYRLIAIAFISALTGSLLYLSSTNRAFIETPPAYMIVDNVVSRLEEARKGTNITTVVRNVVARSGKLRGLKDDYWLREQEITAEFMQDEAVNEEVKKALASRVKINKANEDAAEYAANVMEYTEGSRIVVEKPKAQ